MHTSVIEGFGYPPMYTKALKIPVLMYNGDVDPLVKQNTILWNEDSLKNRNEFMSLFEKSVDLEKAKKDAEQCTFERQKDKILKVIK